MILAHYVHRLPADYDMAIVRARAQRLAPEWDRLPNLHFKAVLLREKGIQGAAGNSYSSLYLWRAPQALAEFLSGGRFRVVTQSFGRPAIDLRLPIDARRGPAREATLALIEEIFLPLDADPSEFLTEEAGRNRALAHRPEIVAAVTAVDTRDWKITRAVLAAGPSTALPGAAPHQVLHLARPNFDELP